MPTKYDPLRRFLEDCADDEPVSMTFDEVDVFVGGLPPSARGRTWWGDTTNTTRVKAHARLGAGRRVSEDRVSRAIVFSPVDAGMELSSRRRVWVGVASGRRPPWVVSLLELPLREGLVESLTIARLGVRAVRKPQLARPKTLSVISAICDRTTVEVSD
jgi:hypothetical protein